MSKESDCTSSSSKSKKKDRKDINSPESEPSKKHKKRKRKYSTSSTSSMSSSDSSSSSDGERKHRKSSNKKSRSKSSSSSKGKRAHKSKSSKKHKTKKAKKDKIKRDDKPFKHITEDVGPVYEVPAEPRKGPMTKEEWDKQQSVVRRVFDPDTGRTRLVKGSGEIIEEIVSKDEQKRINKLATQGDGISYSLQTGTLRTSNQ